MNIKPESILTVSSENLNVIIQGFSLSVFFETAREAVAPHISAFIAWHFTFQLHQILFLGCLGDISDFKSYFKGMRFSRAWLFGLVHQKVIVIPCRTNLFLRPEMCVFLIKRMSSSAQRNCYVWATSVS